MSPLSKTFLDDIIKQINRCEEIGGPEDGDYDAVMQAVADDALQRIKNHHAWNPPAGRDEA